MSSAFNFNGCFILQRNDVSKAMCKRVESHKLGLNVDIDQQRDDQ